MIQLAETLSAFVISFSKLNAFVLMSCNKSSVSVSRLLKSVTRGTFRERAIFLELAIFVKYIKLAILDVVVKLMVLVIMIFPLTGIADCVLSSLVKSNFDASLTENFSVFALKGSLLLV